MVDISLISAPAAKAFSDPVMTMQRTLSLASAFSSAVHSSSRSCVFKAFSASGRFSLIRQMWSLFSTFRVS